MSSTAPLPTATLLSVVFSSGCPSATLDGSGWFCSIDYSNYGTGIYWLYFDGGYFVGSHTGTATISGTVDLSNAGRTDLLLNNTIQKAGGNNASLATLKVNEERTRAGARGGFMAARTTTEQPGGSPS